MYIHVDRGFHVLTEDVCKCIQKRSTYKATAVGTQLVPLEILGYVSQRVRSSNNRVLGSQVLKNRKSVLGRSMISSFLDPKVMVL